MVVEPEATGAFEPEVGVEPIPLVPPQDVYREAKQVAPEPPMPMVTPHLGLVAPLSSNPLDNS